MTESAAPRAAVLAIAGIVIAAIALLLVGIAVALGWLPWDTGVLRQERVAAGAEPAGPAIKPIPVPEDPNRRPDPLMPRYAQPTPPPPAPPRPRDEADRARAEIFATRPRMIPAPEIDRPAPGPAPAPAAEEPGPLPPSYARMQPRPPEPEPRQRRRGGSCEECGRVMRVTMFPGGVWELRVEFEDGSLRTYRSRRRPPFGAGEHVRLEDDYLVRD